VSAPIERAPAGIITLAEPFFSAVDAELNPAPDKTTEPVGTGSPAPPLTPMLIVTGCAVVIVDGEGVTEIAGVTSDIAMLLVPVAPV